MNPKIKFCIGLVTVTSLLTVFFVSLCLISLGFQLAGLVFSAGAGFLGAVFCLPYFFVVEEAKKE
jgi:NADH:ubiquinone oxidoreductase subunit 6 (subunit J)